jgi:hypothetical protein
MPRKTEIFAKMNARKNRELWGQRRLCSEQPTPVTSPAFEAGDRVRARDLDVFNDVWPEAKDFGEVISRRKTPENMRATIAGDSRWVYRIEFPVKRKAIGRRRHMIIELGENSLVTENVVVQAALTN